MEEVTRIFVNDRFIKIDPEQAPKSSRELRSFLFYNNAPTCFMKGVGGWYKITRQCTTVFVNRVLYTMSFKDWLEVALNDNF